MYSDASYPHLIQSSVCVVVDLKKKYDDTVTLMMENCFVCG